MEGVKPAGHQTLPTRNAAMPRGEDVRPLSTLAAAVPASVNHYTFTDDDVDLLERVLAEADNDAEKPASS